jgi:hypothetical protein
MHDAGFISRGHEMATTSDNLNSSVASVSSQHSDFHEAPKGSSPTGLFVCAGDPTAFIDGIPVYGDSIRVPDLLDWIEERDAGCAEYLIDNLRSFCSNKPK